MRRRHLLVSAGCVLAAACAPAVDPALRAGPADHRFYVTSNDWHTRVVVPTAAISPGLLPEAEALPDAAWLAIGWGDHAFYPMEDPPAALALEAALLPGPAVIHLIARAAAPRAAPGFEVLELAVTEAGLHALVESVDSTIDRGTGRPAPIAAPGLYPDSLFFPAQGRFHLFNTCNTWTARQLIAAGLAIRSRGVVTAEDLMGQLRDLPMASPALA